MSFVSDPAFAAEQVQDIAVTALSSAQIETRGLTTMAIRGQSVADTLLTQDGPVGLYIDGVINSRISGALTDLVNLERIGVLRGQQGTLYGRYSDAGYWMNLNISSGDHQETSGINAG